MAITRLQLPREMYATGDIVEMTESLEAGAPPIRYSGDMRPEMEMRQPYGLGSFVKKALKKGKKVLDNPLVQTGLSLFPATRPYAMAYSALRNKDPISAYMALNSMYPMDNNMILNIDPRDRDALPIEIAQKRKAVKEASKYIERPEGGYHDLLNKLLYTKQKGGSYVNKLDPLKVALGAGAGLLGVAGLQARENKKMPTLDQVIGDRGSKIGLDDIQMKVQAAIDSGDKASYENLRVTENLTFLPPWESIKKAEGGRIGYAAGGETSAEMLEIIQKLRAEGKTELEIQQILQQMFSVKQGITSSMAVPQRQSILEEIINYTPVRGGPIQQFDMAKIQETIPKAMQTSADVPNEVSQMMKGSMMKGSMMKDMQKPKENEMPLPDISPYAAAEGGRIGALQGGLMNLGGMEMDLRGGGFVPLGKAEKADDVPARLSKNEFVFTADAVKAAGDGDVDRGADKMYNTMKQLESRVG